MTNKGSRKFTAEFKTKAVMGALKGRSTMEEQAHRYGLHPTQINNWKRDAGSNMASVFSADKSEGIEENGQQTEKLYAQIGRLKVKIVYIYF